MCTGLLRTAGASGFWLSDHPRHDRLRLDQPAWRLRVARSDAEAAQAQESQDCPWHRKYTQCNHACRIWADGGPRLFDYGASKCIKRYQRYSRVTMSYARGPGAYFAWASKQIVFLRISMLRSSLTSWDARRLFHLSDLCSTASFVEKKWCGGCYGFHSCWLFFSPVILCQDKAFGRTSQTWQETPMHYQGFPKLI